MNQPGTQSENHDNPYTPYTQDRQNWDNQLEQLRERERQERDRQTCTQQLQDQQRWQEQQTDQRAQEVFRRNEAAGKRKELQARNRANKTETPKAVSRTKPKSKAKPQPKNQPWSNPWALIGMAIGGVIMYSQVKGMENPWWTVGLAAVFLGFLAGRFYKIIVFCIKLAIVLAIGLSILNLWINRDKTSELSLLPNNGSSWRTVNFASPA